MLKKNLHINTLLFANDQVIIQDVQDKLHKSLYILHQLSKDYNLKITADKTKVMAFKGKYLMRSKIETEGSILEQVIQFNYLVRYLRYRSTWPRGVQEVEAPIFLDTRHMKW